MIGGLRIGVGIGVDFSPAPGGSGDTPDPGFVFVFDDEGRQVFHEDGRAVVVPESYANFP